MIRIRQQIDKSLENAKWLVDNYIEILKDEKAEINDETLERHRRFKAFTYVTNKLNPISEIQEVELKTVLKKLAQLYPEVYIEIIKKKFRNESEVNEN